MRFSKLIIYSKIFDKIFKYDRSTTRSCSCSTKPPSKADTKVEPGKKGLVLGIYQKNNKLCLTPAAEEVNQKSGGKICKYLNQFASEMKMGKAFVVTDLVPEYSAVALSLLGPKGCAYNELESIDEERENIRWCVGAGVHLLRLRGCGAIDVDTATAPDAAAEAAELAAWRFDVFKAPGDRKPHCTVSPYGKGDAKLWAEGSIRGRAQNWARFLSDMPANKMTPVDLAQAAIDMLCPLGVQVQAHDRAWVEAQRMRAFMAVARGSCQEPVFLEVAYRAATRDAPPVLVAAKGVTFDSGGICLKKRKSMSDNRGSMAGAAVALGAMKALALLKVPINVNMVIPLCENMVSGQCMKVGDVVQALNGLSIQIENTDFEGRLMMADALVYGQALYKPSLVIDVATFTHGVLMATGGGAFGCFSNSECAWQAARLAGAVSGDRPWRFPLWEYYQKQIIMGIDPKTARRFRSIYKFEKVPSGGSYSEKRRPTPTLFCWNNKIDKYDPSVDLRNKGSGHATPCLGAAFLKNFICGDWVHMDITGVGKVASFVAPPYLDPRRMTGRPCRTLTTLLANIAKDSQKKSNKGKEQKPLSATCVAKQ